MSRANALLVTVAGLSAWRFGAPWPLALAGLASLLALQVVVGPRRRWGAANAVTTVRLALVLCVAAAPPHVATPLLGVAAVVVLGLDALDGWLARRLGTASDFGALFDMETDGLFVLVLGFVAFTRGLAGPFVLLGGALRPLYVLCSWLRPVTTGEQPRSWFGRLAFLAVASGLSVLLFVPGSGAQGAALAGTAWVTISFARGFVTWALSPRAVTPRR